MDVIVGSGSGGVGSSVSLSLQPSSSSVAMKKTRVEFGKFLSWEMMGRLRIALAV
jgi:hypothetical protein